MGRGKGKAEDQKKKDCICGKCGTGWDTLSLKYSCCEKDYKKNSGTKKAGIARNSGATGSGSGSKSESKKGGLEQKDGSEQPKGEGKASAKSGST